MIALATTEASVLAAALDRAGYDEAAVLRLLGIEALPTDRRLLRSLPLHLRRTREPARLSTLVRLFLLGQSVPAASVAEALPGIGDGLLQTTPAGVRSAVQVIPVQNLRIAADWTVPVDPGPEPVMGVAASTRALAQLMITGRAEQALDLGAGSGVLGLLAARHAGHVTAVDLNPRAAEFTRFNAALNDVTNIACRTGNLFDPVRDELFDLIVCNPPFVIAPARGRMHSQLGLSADDLLRSIVQAAPRHLRPGGFCQVIGNWIHPAGGEWKRRLASWFDGLGCDVWVLHARTEDAATYAHDRIAETTEDAVDSARLFDEWLADYDRAGIAAIEFGIITLRRSDRPTTWFACDPLPETAGACGTAIAAGFARRDFLAAHPGDQLLSARLRRADDLWWDRRSELTPAGWSSGTGRLRLTKGLQFVGTADSAVAGFVAQCAGTATLAEHVGRIASDRGLNRQQFMPAFLSVVRRLIELGILQPIE